METKSPFYIVENFISPLMCEELIDLCDFNIPNKDTANNYIKTSKTCEQAELIIYDRLVPLLPKLQAHYNLVYRGTERVQFEFIPEGADSKHQCENAEFVRSKWLRTKSRDLSAILFMSDYQEQVPFEEDYEVLGGKLEFAQHKFGFNPARGTLVVFPSDPHFINNTTPVLVGDLYQARIQIAATVPYIYQPALFPGN